MNPESVWLAVSCFELDNKSKANHSNELYSVLTDSSRLIAANNKHDLRFSTDMIYGHLLLPLTIQRTCLSSSLQLANV